MPIALKPEQTTIYPPAEAEPHTRWYQRVWRFCAGSDPISRAASVGAYMMLAALAGLVLSPVASIFTALAIVAFVSVKAGARRWPQAVGMLCSTIGFQAVVIVFSMLLTPLLVYNGSYELGGAFLIAPIVTTLATTISTHSGVHKGWTALLSHLPMWCALLALVWLPQYASALACAATAIGIAIVVARSQMSTSRKSVGKSFKKRTARSGAVLIIGILSAGMLTLSAPADEAKAFDWSFGLGDKMLCGIVSPNPTPTPVGNGPEQALPSGNLAGLTPTDGEPSTLMDTEMQEMQNGASLDSYTLYEVSGLRGLNYINWVKDKEGESTSCMFMPWVGVTVGNFINNIGLFSLQLVIAIKEFSQVSNPFEPLYTSFTPSIMALANVMFTMFAVTFLLVVLVAGARASRQKLNLHEALGKITGSLVVVFIAAISYAGLGVATTWNSPNGNGFYTVMSYLDGAAGQVNSAVSNEILGYVQEGEDAMCVKPAGGNVVETGQRYSSCILAEAMAYEPWALATFGAAGDSPIEPLEGSVPAESAEADTDALGEDTAATPLPCYNDYQDCNDLRTYLISQVGGPDITGRMQQCLGANEFDPEAAGADNQAAYVACEPYHAVANDLMARSSSGDNPQDASIISSFRGQSSGSNHFTQAFVGLLSTFTVGLGIALFAAATIYYHARLFMLFLMGPITLTMASFKGVDHATKWLSNLAQTVIIRLVYGIMTTIIIFAVSTISSMEMSSGYRLLMLGLILLIATRMVREADTMTQIGGADGDVNSSPVGSVMAGNLASKAVTGIPRSAVGGIKKTGKAALTGAKWGAIGAGAAAYTAGRVGSRPVRGAAADLAAHQAGKKAFKQRQNGKPAETTFAQREESRAAMRTEQATAAAAGRLNDPSVAAQRVGKDTTGSPSTSKPTGAGTSRVGGNSSPYNQPAANTQPTSTAHPNNGMPQEQRDATGTHSKRDAVRRAAGSTRSAFTSDPNGRSRLGQQYRSELYHQWVEEDNARRNSENRDVLSLSERRQMRRQVKNASPEQVVDATRGLTQDQKFQRLTEMQREQNETSRVSPGNNPGTPQRENPYGRARRNRRRRR